MKRLIGVAAAALTLALPAWAEESDAIKFCMAKAEQLISPTQTRPWTIDEHQELMLQHGISCAVFFYNPTTEDNLRVPYAVIDDRYLDEGYPTVMTLVIDDDGATRGSSAHLDTVEVGLLPQVVAGDFDYAFELLAKRVASDGRLIHIQPLHEGNGWDKHGMCAEGNSQELYVQSFQRIVRIFEEAGADNALFVMNWNRRGCDGVLGDADNYFDAIDELVVAHSVSSYNRYGTADQYDEDLSFAAEFAPIYDRLVGLTDKPIWVAEVSTSGQGEPRLSWFKQMLSDLETRFPRVERVTFFFGDVKIGDASNDTPIRWGFGGDEEQIRQFRQLIDSYDQAALEHNAPPQLQTRPQARPAPKEAASATQGKPTEVRANTSTISATKRTIAKSKSADRPAVTAPATKLTFGRRFEYAGWLNLSHAIGDEPIPGYGQAGLLAQGNVRFSYLPESGSVRSGPYILFGGVASNNCDPRYWQCQARAEVGYSWSFDNRAGWPYDSEYNSLRFDIGVGHRHYWQDAGRPGRLDYGDTYGLLGLTWTFGGVVGQ